MPRNASKLHDPEIYDILFAAWVLACNDENSIITYEGLIDRLELPSGYDIRGAINSRRELFRVGVPQSRLERWKNDMRKGKRLPAWISAIDEPQLRQKCIDDLGPTDAFRSQFRTGEDAPKSSPELLEWGLSYLGRLREASLQFHQKNAVRWQIIIGLVVAILNITAAVIVTSSKQSSTPPAGSK